MMTFWVVADGNIFMLIKSIYKQYYDFRHVVQQQPEKPVFSHEMHVPNSR